MTLGENIKKIRKLKYMNQEQLAEKAGFHHTYISHIETDRTNIQTDNLIKILKALKCNPKEVYSILGL